MVKTWKDMLDSDEVKMLQQLDNQLSILKHKRYKIQNAATKRVFDEAKKAKTRKQPKKSKSKPRQSVQAERRTPQPTEGGPS
jgi:hypothetical protein